MSHQSISSVLPKHTPWLGTEVRATLSLALPLIGFQLGYILMGLVDLLMIGRVSVVAMAGTGVGSALWTAIQVLGIGLMMGMDPLLSQAIGAGRFSRARAVVRQGFVLAVIAAIPLALLAMSGRYIFTLAGVAPEVALEADRYVMARLVGLVPMLMSVTARNYLQTTQGLRTLVFAIIAANVINVIANGLFIFGDAALLAVGLPGVGLPALGVTGAALATSTSTFAALVIMLRGMSLRRRPGEEDDADESLNSWVLSRSMLRLGLPVAMQLFAEVAAFTLASTLSGRMGSLPAAAHNLTMTVATFPLSIALGIGSATAIRVGYAVGREAPGELRRASLAGLAICGCAMLGTGLLLFFAPEALTRLLTDDPRVLAAAPGLLRIAALFQLSDGTQVLAASALRGAGDTRTAMFANFLGYYVLGLPLGVALGLGAGMGVAGLWWGLALGLTTTAIILLARLFALFSRPVIART